MKPNPMFNKEDLPVITSVEVITYDDEIRKVEDALQAASTSLLRLKNRFSLMPDDVYYAEFDTPILLMENKLKELVGEDDE